MVFFLFIYSTQIASIGPDAEAKAMLGKCYFGA